MVNMRNHKDLNDAMTQKMLGTFYETLLLSLFKENKDKFEQVSISHASLLMMGCVA